MFLCLTNEGILDRVNINIGDCSQGKILPKLDDSFFQPAVEELSHLIERSCTSSLVHLCGRDFETIQDVGQTTNRTGIMYPE